MCVGGGGVGGGVGRGGDGFTVVPTFFSNCGGVGVDNSATRVYILRNKNSLIVSLREF